MVWQPATMHGLGLKKTDGDTIEGHFMAVLRYRIGKPDDDTICTLSVQYVAPN